MSRRRTYHLPTLDAGDYYTTDDDLTEVPPDSPEAQMASSLLDNGRHSPAIDIDFAARLEPSTTPGHFHLYLDGIEMDDTVYADLLRALHKAGVIQKGFLKRWEASGMTLLRLPHVKKKNPKPPVPGPIVVRAEEEKFWR